MRERSYGLLEASDGKSFAVHKACEYELFEDFGVSWFGGVNRKRTGWGLWVTHGYRDTKPRPKGLRGRC